ncbi:alpha-L-rhamnosidase-related protein [Arcicella rigui]|uniref:Alpha-L-rhamnosidase C-terminal domain-containing protein n=1 Tax=Arcicella rigui TaxID=797020 RepID=A0ABU5QFS0_9BACT|nr:alpha-L-rhamnosidase C-terminal domain-containing protein [Arcicella rigui]MEA5141129.1 alpha-L-rhamnosidase C-terminal domain-containing protein [Arcicella rigui]
MKIITRYSIAFLLICMICVNQLFSQNTNPDLLFKPWQASWITPQNINPNAYGVYYFRKPFELSHKPNSFTIHVSADNRYKLFVNEKLVSLGPARGDLDHWNYETVDIAAYLKEGNNIIAAQVWNEGEVRPEAQITFRTAFILQGASDKEAFLNTNETWKCLQDDSYAPLVFNINTYYVAGSGEIRQLEKHPKNWQSQTFNDAHWQNAQKLFNGMPKNFYRYNGFSTGWRLVPSSIPQMELRDERFQKIAKKEGNVLLPADFPSTKREITIPANTSVRIMLDQSYLTNAYPNVIFSGGKKASITMKYAEALFKEFPIKANRNDIEGMKFIGRTDSLISDGSDNQKFTTLTFRTYRYVELSIKTQESPLTLNDIYGTFTGYPFELKSKIESSIPELDNFLTIGWRTARLCATETYMDCPYYEQLQYIGDGRIQALVSLYNTGDDRLVKNALNLMDFSRIPEGLTSSRHPSYTPQYIPTFSLWYIGILHDYSRYGTDLDFVRAKMGSVRQVFEYFKKYQQADGSLKDVPYWMFTDWVDFKEWNDGIGPSSHGNSAMLDLQLLWAYQIAVDLETKFGMPELALRYQKSIDLLAKTIRDKYWDSDKKLFADRIEKDIFSQHTNALAILTGIVATKDLPHLTKQLLTDKTLAPASIYFKYYLHQALIKAGLGNDYLKWLDKWRENLSMGLTTWAETSDLTNTRSDCHAWGSSPNIEFYRTILGIDSDAPAFKAVKIEPHLGDIQTIKGEMPHPDGKIKVDYKLVNNKLKAIIELPKVTKGRFVWQGKTYPLKGGINTIKI